MKGSEFLRKVNAAGKRNGVSVRFVPRRGVGSHGTLFYGSRFTVLKDLKKELPKSLFHAMVKQLGLRPADLIQE